MQLARQGGLLVDVDANMGYFSLLWAGVNPSVRVISFEAAPRNIALLKNNVTRNRLEDRIKIIPKAVGKSSGTISFEAGPAEQTGWSGITTSDTASTITVPLVRLDQELPDPSIDVHKIDVEAADTWVLFGCEALLKKNGSARCSLSRTGSGWGLPRGKRRNFSAISITTASRWAETMASG